MAGRKKQPLATLRHYFSNPKRVFLTFVGILLVAAIFLAAWSIIDKDTPQQTEANLSSAADAVATKQDYDKALAISLEALENADTPEAKFAANMSVAGWYTDKQDYDKAMEHYRAAEKLVADDVNVYLGIATAARGAGDYQTARDYYEKARQYYLKNQKPGDQTSALLNALETQYRTLQAEEDLAND